MRKKFLTVLTTLAICGMTCSTAFASIDTSVFENKTEYDVEIDDFDDTGIISFVGGDDQPSGILGGFVKDDDDKGYIYGTVDIKLIQDGEIAVPRIIFIYYGEDWIFTDKIIIKTTDHRYTFDVTRDTNTDDGKIYEICTLVLTDESIQLLKDIAEGSVSVMDIRFSGDRKVDGTVVFDLDAMKELYEDYAAAGGLDQDLSILHDTFPCAVKDLTKDSSNEDSTEDSSEETTETTLEEATENANSKISEWNDKNLNSYQYVPMESNEGFFNIILLATDDTDLSESAVEAAAKEAYDGLKECFKGHDISIGIILAKSADEVLKTYSEEDLAALK